MKTVDLYLKRIMAGKKQCQGELSLPNGTKFYTLEPSPFRNSYPCIPEGTYALRVAYSPKFGKLMLLLAGVPNRRGILIHPGNSFKDTKGCILVGLTTITRLGIVQLLHSRDAYSLLISSLHNLLGVESFSDGDTIGTITIESY